MCETALVRTNLMGDVEEKLFYGSSLRNSFLMALFLYGTEPFWRC